MPGDMLLLDNMGRVVAVPTNEVPSALRPAADIGMERQTPNPTTGASMPQEILQRTRAGAAGFQFFPDQRPPLMPYLASQEEIGVKTNLGQMFLTAALFRIDKNAYTVTSDNRFTEGGTEVHQGVELTATGKITRDWTVCGGVTFLDATIEDQKINKAGASLAGKTPDGVPQQVAKLYTEYAIPQVPGLSLTGGVSYVGWEYVDNTPNKNMNRMSIPAVVTGEVGCRYKTRVQNHDLTLRFNILNVSGENYWTSKGDNMLYLGDPRTFVFSAELAWF